MDTDLQVRIAAFDWLAEQTAIHGDVLPWKILLEGYKFQGERISLVAQQGIFKPRILDLPTSIRTTPGGPYDDYFGPDNFLMYHYQGTDPQYRDNAGLRRVFELQRPLVYFHGIVPGRYMAVWPVYIMGEDPGKLSFKVALDELTTAEISAGARPQVAEAAEARRAYLTATVRVRLHQRSFRERVIDAYRSQCAFCRLKHRELLDAAHIIPDTLPEGKPTVDNGISLCKLHHAAYDSFILGVTPDFIIQVRPDVLEEEDGPILQHGLKGLHETKLILPASRSQWPNRDSLAWRYERFSKAG